MPMPSEPLPARDVCCAVVVTYHPDDGLPGRVARVAAQVGRVLVVDNGSGEGTRSMLLALSRAHPAVELVLLETNEGVGEALNRGVARAAASGYRWVLTLDQDTEVEPTLVEELAAIYAAHPARERVKLLAPNFFEGPGEVALPSAGAGVRWREATTAITSGALLSVDAFRSVGPFRGDFFIDSVDEEYCLRLRRHGLAVVASTRPLMTHALGNRRMHRLLGCRFMSSHHAPFRRFYMMRNRVLTLRRYAWREPRWALARLWLTATELVLTPALEGDPGAKLKAMLLGLRDGLLGRTGKVDRTF